MIVSFAMADIAFELGMGLIEYHAGDTMVEIRWFPVVVTLNAVCLKGSYPLADFVARPAGKMPMIFTQTPVRDIVCEGGFFLFAMTQFAIVAIVTIIADCVNFFGAFRGCLRVGGSVAVTTSFVVMTIGAVQTKQIGMIRMIKSNLGSLLNRSAVYLFARSADCHLGRSGLAGWDSRRRPARLIIQMALDALGRTAPCFMTTQTLAVVHSFETRLAQRLRLQMTFGAGENPTLGAEVMTGDTAVGHRAHFGMALVIKGDRFVHSARLPQLDQTGFWPFVVGRIKSVVSTETFLEAGFRLCRPAAQMAVAAGGDQGVLGRRDFHACLGQVDAAQDHKQRHRPNHYSSSRDHACSPALPLLSVRRCRVPGFLSLGRPSR